MKRLCQRRAMPTTSSASSATRSAGDTGRGVQAAHELVRKKVPTMETDRELHKDIAQVAALIDSGELLATVRGACYESRACAK